MAGIILQMYGTIFLTFIILNKPHLEKFGKINHSD